MMPFERANANVFEVKPGSGMHYGGHRLGWYWDSPDDDEPHGPFDSAEAARRDAAFGAPPDETPPPKGTLARAIWDARGGPPPRPMRGFA